VGVRLLALVQKPRGRAPNQRFRIEQWDRHLRDDHGVEVDLLPFESEALSAILYEPGRRAEKALLVLRDFVRRAGALGTARRYDGVLVLREAALLGPPVYEWLLARERIPLIYDFDDAIWTTAPEQTANSAYSWLHFRRKTATITRLAAAVTVGNAFLGRWASQFNRRVSIVPTSIDLDAYPVQPALPPPGPSRPFVIVWSGTFSTLAHLETVRPAIEALARRRPVCMRVICDRPPARPFAGATNDFVRWTAEREAVDIGHGHVGIMPLPDLEFMHGKCGCKALQYMGAGLPAIVSPIGVNADIVANGENGLFATAMDDWINALEALASSTDLRQRFARAGRATVEAGFSARTSAGKFAAAVRAALGAPPPRS
jgi:glycosyltransferase involved in cell wall biosynthesis